MAMPGDCIIVLCRNYQEARDAFDIFVSYLDELYPLDTSVFVDEFANIVDTYHGLRYIFIHEAFLPIYENRVYGDTIFVDEFMEGISYH